MRREKPLLPEKTILSFKAREEKALALIKESNLEFIELGIFGSYARNDYRGSSDIDILAIVTEHPPVEVSGPLRDTLDRMRVQLVYGTLNLFNDENKSAFAREVRRDYIRRL